MAATDRLVGNAAAYQRSFDKGHQIGRAHV